MILPAAFYHFSKRKLRPRFSAIIPWIISIIQISFGAALRGEFEIVLKQEPYLSDLELFDAVVWVKYIHIALGVLVAVYSLYLCWKFINQKQFSNTVRTTAVLMSVLICIEVIGGFLFRHFGLVGLMRIYHLWLGTLHICFLLYLFMALRYGNHQQSDNRSQYNKAIVFSALIFLIMGMIAWQTIRIAETAHQVPYLAAEDSELFTGVVPEFEFTDRDGSSFGLNDMKGKFVILNFMFTQCKEICPMSTSKLFRELYKRYEKEALIQFVSISVDPENDTLAELSAFAKRNGIEDENKKWVFLRGELEDVKTLSRDGFRLMDDFPERHSPRYILIDNHGKIRSTHPYEDDKSIELLQNYIEQLVRNFKNEHE